MAVSKPRFGNSVSKATFCGQKPSLLETSSGVRLRRSLQGQIYSQNFGFFKIFVFFNILKSGDSEPGTPLERSGSKFCAKCRARELRSIYGDPFGEDFVPIGVGQRSGASSFTFSLVPGTRAQVLGPPKADFFEDVPSGITGLEHIRGFPLSSGSGVMRRSSEPPFLTRRGSG